MSTLIVGGDRVNTYKDYLLSQGFGPVLHWDGRKNSACHRTIPSGTRLLVIMVDQVNHGLATKMRRVADELDLPVVFSRRSIGQLGEAINRFRNGAITKSVLQ
ncbi:MAG: putative diverged CheY-domain [Proteobacteria bacterium]|nr:putative diverged CheY-domain [Pseudomonadota bacterium]